jgi:type VI secretion system secreted protein Hcp
MAAGATGAARRGDVILGDIVCVHELDKASPKLMEAVCTGVVIPRVEIVLTRDVNGQQQPYLAYELKNVIVTSYCLGAGSEGLRVDNIGSSGQDGVVDPATGAPPAVVPEKLPPSNLSLHFEEIKVTYTEFDRETGAPKGQVDSNWRVEAGTL